MTALHWIFASIAIFLIGTNLAFIFLISTGLVMWFKVKISAVTLMLVFVSTAMLYAHPDDWRFAVGAVAVIADLVAVLWMWHSVQTFRRSRVLGYIPLIVRKERVPSD